jgi:nucleoid-associated protein YgaU
MYKKKHKKRGVSTVEHYETPEMTIIEQDILDSIDVYEYVWKQGDCFWRIAEDFYGVPENWWMIAEFNRTPTEAHLRVGQIIRIPVNLNDLLELL